MQPAATYNPSTPGTGLVTQSQLTSGQQNLVVAQARLSAIKNGTQDAQIKNAASQVTAARERLKSLHAQHHPRG